MAGSQATTLAFRGLLLALVDSVLVPFKNGRIEKKPFKAFVCSEMQEPLACQSAFLRWAESPIANR